MKPPWKQYKHLKEIVYVSDMDTFELTYLNPYGRSVFGLSDPSDYVGKKCYSVLQGFDAPCMFCTNDHLCEDRFFEWTYENPILKHKFLLKDTLVRYNGRRYHMELAIDSDRIEGNVVNALLHHEAFVNECLTLSSLEVDPDHTIDTLLQYLGVQFGCTSISVSQIQNNTLVQTNCWTPSGPGPAPAPLPVDDMMRNSPFSRQLRDENPITLSQAESLFRPYPALYEYFAPQGVDIMVLCPLTRELAVDGFLRIDNPRQDTLRSIITDCKLLSLFISSILRRRSWTEHLKQLSYHDHLTGALNRHALQDYMEEYDSGQPIGVVYCDIIGLKSINDSQGHAKGDLAITCSYNLLCSLFPPEQVYRIGGDEFLILCPGETEEGFQRRVEHLQAQAIHSEYPLSIGNLWDDGGGALLSELIQEADHRMYEDKRAFYRALSQSKDSEVSDRDSLWTNRAAFRFFLQHFYFDPTTFLDSIVSPDSPYYFYCGDLQRNIFFISDNLKADFAFPGNLVSNFVEVLEEKIDPEDQQAHKEDWQDTLRDKRTAHDIRYRIRNSQGHLVWMHCHGTVKWNADRSTPLFFSGIMTVLRDANQTDPVTTFPTAESAYTELSELCRSGSPLMVLCFSLQNFSDINQIYGRKTGDEILHTFGARLDQALGYGFRFFRLSGAHFLAVSKAVVDPAFPSLLIKNTAETVYREHGIYLIYPCSVGVLFYPDDAGTAKELVDRAISVAQMATTHPDLDYLRYTPNTIQDEQDQTQLRFALNYSVSHDFEGFRIVVQPQVEPDTGVITGGEVLLRWTYKGEAISPTCFIPILEQSGLIIPVGKWVFKQTALLCQRLQAVAPGLRLSFNVSYTQIIDDTFQEYIKSALEVYQIPGRCLGIELTESRSDEMPEALSKFVNKCRNMGILFILDDFGNAYSSLQLLLRYPVDMIKLDRSLVLEAVSDHEKLDLVASIIYACHRFHKQVCVEGVETAEDLALMRQSGCDYIQGFYFYRPLEVEDLFRILSTAPLAEPTPAIPMPPSSNQEGHHATDI